MRRIATATLLFLTLASGAASAQSDATVEERMSGAEFKAAGLDKLSPEELAALNAWLQKQSARAMASGVSLAAPPEDRNGFDDSSQRQDIHAHIAGEFTGWTGNAEFVLDNGQVWRQIDAARLVGIKPMQSPAVTLRPRMLSGWTLQVEGYNARVNVKRVK